MLHNVWNPLKIFHRKSGVGSNFDFFSLNRKFARRASIAIVVTWDFFWVIFKHCDMVVSMAVVKKLMMGWRKWNAFDCSIVEHCLSCLLLSNFSLSLNMPNLRSAYNICRLQSSLSMHKQSVLTLLTNNAIKKLVFAPHQYQELRLYPMFMLAYRDDNILGRLFSSPSPIVGV